MEMFCGVFVGRIVTAPDVTALHAEAKMNPSAADSQTIFTAFRARSDISDLV